MEKERGSKKEVGTAGNGGLEMRRAALTGAENTALVSRVDNEDGT